METDDPDDFARWIASWEDLMEFQVAPVVSSAEAAARARVRVGAPDRRVEQTPALNPRKRSLAPVAG